MTFNHEWVQEFPACISVCDAQGTIIEMNSAGEEVFAEDGGLSLIGCDILACHPEPARTQLKKMMETQTKNVYTITKKGVKKLIFQAPWYKDGQYAGFVELALEIPAEMPHFNRD